MGNQEYVNCRNHVNCGGYAEPKSEYCEECLEEQAEIEAEQYEPHAAIVNLKNALSFYDKVQNASLDAAIPVGTDHFKWLVSAARKVVEAH